MCNAYVGFTPADFEKLHLDQILLMICDEKALERLSGRITGTPEELAAMGLIDAVPEMSVVQHIRKQQQEEEARRKLKVKAKQRRTKRRVGNQA